MEVDSDRFTLCLLKPGPFPIGSMTVRGARTRVQVNVN